MFNGACGGVDHDRKQRCVVRVIELTLVLGNNSLEIGLVFQVRVLRSRPSQQKKTAKKKQQKKQKNSTGVGKHLHGGLIFKERECRSAQHVLRKVEQQPTYVLVPGTRYEFKVQFANSTLKIILIPIRSKVAAHKFSGT